MAKFEQVVQRAIKLVRQVPGQGVQTYTQPLMEDFVNQAFDLCFKKLFWPQYTMVNRPLTLDGATGLITTDFRPLAQFGGPTKPETYGIVQWEDIKSITPSTNMRKRLTRVPSNMVGSLLTGTSPMFVEPTNVVDDPNFTKVFRVIPITAQGTIYVTHRVKPFSTFLVGHDIYLDELMLVYAAIYLYTKDDGHVPDMVDTYEKLFDLRFRDLVKEIEGNIVVKSLDSDVYPSQAAYPITDWH